METILLSSENSNILMPDYENNSESDDIKRKVIMPDYEDNSDVIESGKVCTPECSTKIPTKLSELEDDVGFVKDPQYQHTDNNFTDNYKEILDASEDMIPVLLESKEVLEESKQTIIESKETTEKALQASDRANKAANDAEVATQEVNNSIIEVNKAILDTKEATNNANAAASNAQEKADLADTAALNANQIVDTVTATNEAIRNEEAIRQANEKTRVSNEENRTLEEFNRNAGELLRQSNELTRIDNEAVRQENELKRLELEIQREQITLGALNRTEEAIQNANDAAISANESADKANKFSQNAPRIEGDYWHVWDANSNQYVNTNTNATGDPGKSPIIRAETWWVYDNELSDYVNTNIAVNSTYELSKEKVEGVLNGEVDSHYHDDRYYTELEIDQKLTEVGDEVNITDGVTPNDSVEIWVDLNGLGYTFEGADVNPGPGGGIPEAPNDGKSYGRKNGGWVNIIDDKLGLDATKAPSQKIVTEEINHLKDSKLDLLISGKTIRTINGDSILGDGDLVIKASGNEIVVNDTGEIPADPETEMWVDLANNPDGINIVEEAPNNENIYGRYKESWVTLIEPELGNRTNAAASQKAVTDEFTKVNLKIKEVEENSQNKLTGDITSHNHATQLAEALANYVKKVEGKDLSSNDFTNLFKTKLEGLNNYNDEKVVQAISDVNDRITQLENISKDFSIDTFNEIKAFLVGITDDNTLNGLLDDLRASIPTKVSLLTDDVGFVKDSGYVHTDNNFSDLDKNKLDSLSNFDASTIENNIVNLQNTKADKTELDGLLHEDSISDMLTKTEASDTYQPKGEYLTEHQKLKTINKIPLTGEGDIPIITPNELEVNDGTIPVDNTTELWIDMSKNPDGLKIVEDVPNNNITYVRKNGYWVTKVNAGQIRPNISSLEVGDMFFDTNLDRPIFKSSKNTWVDANGQLIN